MWVMVYVYHEVSQQKAPSTHTLAYTQTGLSMPVLFQVRHQNEHDLSLAQDNVV